MTATKFNLRAAFLAAASIASSYAQQPNSPSNPAPRAVQTPVATIRTTTNLVLLDVVVTNQGSRVQALAQSKFHLYEDGQEQKITTFDEHVAVVKSAQPPPKPLPLDTFTNLRRYPPASALNVILFDTLNTPLDAQANALAQLRLFLQKARPGLPTEVLTLDTGLHLIAGFSEDPAAIARTVDLAGIKPQASTLYDPESEKQRAAVVASTPTEAAARAPHMEDNLKEMSAMINSDRAHDRVTITLQAFAQLSKILQAMPGRKNLIWISGSFPISIEPDASLKDPFYAWKNFADELNQTAKRLAAARVAIYPIDARGLAGLPSANVVDSYNAAGGFVDKSGKPHTAEQSDNDKFLSLSSDERASMRQIADATGGKIFVNTNAIAAAISSAEDDGANYYSLGYVPLKTKLDGKFHTIKVNIEGASYHLAYRSGYLADTEQTAKKNPPIVLSEIVVSKMLGAPPAAQIGIVARLIPAENAEAQRIPLDDQAQGAAVSPSHPDKWRRYVALLAIEPRDIVFDLADDGTRTATVNLALIAFDRYGKSTSDLERRVKLSIPPDRLKLAFMEGLPVRLGLNLPPGFGFIRIAVHDPLTSRVGSVELPLFVTGNP